MAHGVPDPPRGDLQERPPPSVFPLPGPPAPVPGRSGEPPANADWGMRVGSAALDYLVKTLVVLPLLGLGALGFLLSEDAGGVGLLIAAGVAVVFVLAYAPVMMTRERQTVGNRVTGIRVVRSDGTRMSGGRAFVREVLVKYLLVELLGSLFTLYVLPLLNYLWPLWDDRGQALHDKMVDTITVRA